MLLKCRCNMLGRATVGPPCTREIDHCLEEHEKDDSHPTLVEYQIFDNTLTAELVAEGGTSRD